MFPGSGDNGGVEGGLPLPRLYREDPKDCHSNQRLARDTTQTQPMIIIAFQNAVLGLTVFLCTGVNGLTMDKEKQLLTVKGTMDAKKLADTLSEKLKRKVEVVPPAKKDKENGKENESGDKKKGGDGGGKDKNAGNKGGEGVNAMEYVAAQPAYGAAYYPGGPYGYPIQSHAPQIFSDENVNACVVM